MSGFLRRWAERKAAAEAPPPASEAERSAAAEASAIPPESGEKAPGAAPEARPDEIAERLAALPALEEIGPQTDIRPFLQSFVPAALRNAALRRAWTADPIISTHLDVARDYAWEFNAGDLPVGFSRDLGAQSLQRSLDALGEIGKGPAEGPPVTAPEATETAEEGSASATIEATEEPNQAPDEGLPTASPESAATEKAGVTSGLFLRSRHGSALPG